MHTRDERRWHTAQRRARPVPSLLVLNPWLSQTRLLSPAPSLMVWRLLLALLLLLVCHPDLNHATGRLQAGPRRRQYAAQPAAKAGLRLLRRCHDLRRRRGSLRRVALLLLAAGAVPHAAGFYVLYRGTAALGVIPLRTAVALQQPSG